MKTLEEIYKEVYEISINDGNEFHHSDKGTHHSYISVYSNIFEKYRNKEINFLEIGVNRGYSMMTWEKYFPNANLYGIDIYDVAFYKGRYNYIVSDIKNHEFIESNLKNITFDIIIDDGSHNIDDQINALEFLYPKLNKDGIYVIEDIFDLDKTINLFQKYNPEIYDNRIKQNRWDDVLLIIKK